MELEYIEYSKNWEWIHSLSRDELICLDLKLFDEEDLDAIGYKWKELGDEERLIEVYEAMLLSSKQNPAVEYINIYEEVIIYWMNQKNYSKAISFLEDYLIYDEQERKSYRNHFIRRNLGVCYLFEGKVDQGETLITDLIKEAPNNYWNYHDIALEFYFANQKEKAISYLNLGKKEANRFGDQAWEEFFQERIVYIENSQSIN